MSKIETENGTEYKIITKDNLRTAINSLDEHDNSFAIFERDDGSLLQVVNQGGKGLYVDIQSIKNDSIFSCNNNYSSIDEVVKIIFSFFSNEIIKIPDDWIEVKKHSKREIKLFSVLNIFGIVLFILSFFISLFFKNSFSKSSLIYLLLGSLWLMLPKSLNVVIPYIKRFDIDTFSVLINERYDVLIVFITLFMTLIVLIAG
jgi:hypothetical protein